MKTEIITDDIGRAAEIIKSGGVVAVPTETVYGLACNGLSPDAVERIYELKGRPEVKPVSLMVQDKGSIARYCEDVSEDALILADMFWPGPLTIVLKAKAEVPQIVRAGGKTVGLRCPEHPLTTELLRQCGLPLAAPSANPSGEKSPKTAGEVLDYMDGRIEAVIDGGPCRYGAESTVIDMSERPYRVLREGALPESDVVAALRGRVLLIGITGSTGAGKTTALSILSDMGAEILDCDKIYHELTGKNSALRSEIIRRFGAVYEENTLDRKALGKIVFSNSEALRDLNSITHRYMVDKVYREVKRCVMQGHKIVAIDAIALCESGIAGMCDETVAVTAPAEIRIERIIAREGISREYAQRRVQSQKPDAYYENVCGSVLRNDSGLESFKESCKELFGRMIKDRQGK